jgi:hypothetical protein
VVFIIDSDCIHGFVATIAFIRLWASSDSIDCLVFWLAKESLRVMMYSCENSTHGFEAEVPGVGREYSHVGLKAWGCPCKGYGFRHFVAR